uniref:Uncharacterized protein n=1 Tax=Oryza meridionalis TaxID=40149 RepID=A0A0E0EPL4_9ORYZ
MVASGLGQNQLRPRLGVERDRGRTSCRPLSLAAVLSPHYSSLGLFETPTASLSPAASSASSWSTSPPSSSLHRLCWVCSRHAAPDPPLFPSTLAPPPTPSKLAAAMDGWTTAVGISAAAPARARPLGSGKKWEKEGAAAACHGWVAGKLPLLRAHRHDSEKKWEKEPGRNGRKKEEHGKGRGWMENVTAVARF